MNDELDKALMDACDVADHSADVMQEIIAILDGIDALLGLFESPSFTVPKSPKRLLTLAFDRCDYWADYFKKESKRLDEKRAQARAGSVTA